MGQEEVVGKLKESRKDLAKVKTLLRELELGDGIVAPADETAESDE